jgi:hypothetical protein
MVIRLNTNAPQAAGQPIQAGQINHFYRGFYETSEEAEAALAYAQAAGATRWYGWAYEPGLADGGRIWATEGY